MKRFLLPALFALLTACASEQDNKDAGWVQGVWLTSEITAVTGGVWTLEVPTVPPKGNIDAVWTPRGSSPMPAAVLVDGDRVTILALGSGGGQGNLRRSSPTRMDGNFQGSGPNAITSPLTLIKR